MHAESLVSRSKKLLVASFAALTAAEMADSASSWGKLESNPVLGQSRFDASKAGVKLGMVSGVIGAQYLILRHRSPTAYKMVAAFNFASAGALGAIAYRNMQIPQLPK
jgi:hypothetical protein